MQPQGRWLVLKGIGALKEREKRERRERSSMLDSGRLMVERRKLNNLSLAEDAERKIHLNLELKPFVLCFLCVFADSSEDASADERA